MRVNALKTALKEAQIPPRWFPDFDGGYGSPYPSFYAMAFYYPAALLNILGVGEGAALELMAYLALVASGLTMYMLGARVCGRPSGLLAAVLYMYAPYHLVDAFVRGAYGELGAFVWFPLLAISLLTVGFKAGRLWTLLAAFAVAGLILTHNLMAMIFLPTVLIVALVCLAVGSPMTLALARKSLSRLGAALGLGLLLSAYFWLPLAIENKFVRLDYFLQFDYRGDFVGLRNLVGYQATPGFTTEAGVLLLIFSMMAIGLSFLVPLDRSKRAFLIVFFVAGLGNLWMTTRFSNWLWKTVPGLEFVQFPWRFLAPASFYLASTASALPWFASRKSVAWGIAGAGAVLAIAFHGRLANIADRSFIEAIDSARVCQEVWGTQDYRPIWSQTLFWTGSAPPVSAEANNVLEPCPAGVTAQADVGLAINELVRSGREWKIEYSAEEEASIIVPMFYYPGWGATVDGLPATVAYSSPNGLLVAHAPRGTHRLALSFHETWVRRLANSLSLGGVAVATGILTSPRLRRRTADPAGRIEWCG